MVVLIYKATVKNVAFHPLSRALCQLPGSNGWNCI